MDWAVYAALVASFVAVVATAAYLGVRALQAWRDLKRLRRRLGSALDHLESLGGHAADKAAHATDQAQLEESLGRLRVSLARLAVLRSALDEATAVVGRLAAVYPRK